MFACKVSCFGKTKLYINAMVKDPKDPPENRGFNINLKLNNSHEQKLLNWLFEPKLQNHDFASFLASHLHLLHPRLKTTTCMTERGFGVKEEARIWSIKRNHNMILTYSCSWCVGGRLKLLHVGLASELVENEVGCSVREKGKRKETSITLWYTNFKMNLGWFRVFVGRRFMELLFPCWLAWMKEKRVSYWVVVLS
jgi:hypothetical protein